MNIFILALEPLESRYTGQWFTFLPNKIGRFAFNNDIDTSVWNVAGKQAQSKPTEGAFLNFTDTNIWKNTQINQIAEYFQDGIIQPGDKFIFPDAWHPGIIQVRYMSDLLDIPVEIHSIWHAGSYDPNDFLGRKVKNKSWSYSFEKSLYFASDKNYFATEYHRNLFQRQLGLSYENDFIGKGFVVGLPFDYLEEKLLPFRNQPKENIILFPHRTSSEKQPEIFEDLAKELPEYEFIFCQNQDLTKDEYHALLGRSKMVFSANLQETLGISVYEGWLAGSIPLIPDRLSYTEIWPEKYLYPSIWTSSWENYVAYKEELKAHIGRIMSSTEVELVGNPESYFSMNEMLKEIFNQNAKY